jgi:hypothetical protein
MVMAHPAFAAPYTKFDNFAAYEAALGGVPIITQDFEGFAPGTNLNNVEFLPGVSVTSNLPKVEVFDSGGDQDLFAYGTSERGQGNAFYDINFSQPYNAIGFNIESFDPATSGPAIIEIFFDDQTSVSIDIFPTNATESDPIFFGVIADTPIARIRLTEGPEIVGFEGNEEVALDDFVIATTSQPAPPPPPEPGLPPDPGEAGKATLEGIDSNNDGVRDDVERYIALTVTDSARHREALRAVARVIQRELLAQTKEEAIQLAIEGVRSIECLSYLGVRKQDRWKEVMALMLNTHARLLAMDAHADRITGQVFAGLPNSLKRSACAFDVEALPN